jgi:hypothetical protein
MGKPDALSRRADHRLGWGNNSNMTMLSPELFQIHALSGLDIVGEKRGILRDVQRSLRDDNLEESVAKAARELRRDRGHGTMCSAEWSESDGLLMFCRKIYVPRDQDLHHCIVEQHHDSCITGHAGCWKTLELVAHNYWWPQMSCYIGLYVKTCDLCTWTKLQHRRPHGELYPTETPEERWDTITVDFVVELPDAHGYDVIMNVVDSVGKQAHFMPTHTTVNAEGAVWLYLKEV